MLSFNTSFKSGHCRGPSTGDTFEAVNLVRIRNRDFTWRWVRLAFELCHDNAEEAADTKTRQCFQGVALMQEVPKIQTRGFNRPKKQLTSG
jgi:hypothetical protein